MAGPIDLGIDGLEIVEVIGSGGFSTVYSARESLVRRPVAVKVLNRLDKEADRKRFEQECEIMGRLSGHPNVVTVHQAGYTASGLPYLVLELVADGTLADAQLRVGRLKWHQAADYMAQVCDALGEAHAEEILHRDIKPENILLDGETPKLTDFGIAYLRDSTGATSTHITASWLHTPPETFDNSRDKRSDIYSLGSTLYTLIEGHPPFWREGEDSLNPLFRRLMTETPPPLPSTLAPPALIELVARMLAREPDDRPQSAAEAAGELRAIAGGTSPAGATIPAPIPPSPSTPAPASIEQIGADAPAAVASSAPSVPADAHTVAATPSAPISIEAETAVAPPTVLTGGETVAAPAAGHASTPDPDPSSSVSVSETVAITFVSAALVLLVSQSIFFFASGGPLFFSFSTGGVGFLLLGGVAGIVAALRAPATRWIVLGFVVLGLVGAVLTDVQGIDIGPTPSLLLMGAAAGAMASRWWNLVRLGRHGRRGATVSAVASCVAGASLGGLLSSPLRSVADWTNRRAPFWTEELELVLYLLLATLILGVATVGSAKTDSGTRRSSRYRTLAVVRAGFGAAHLAVAVIIVGSAYRADFVAYGPWIALTAMATGVTLALIARRPVMGESVGWIGVGLSLLGALVILGVVLAGSSLLVAGLGLMCTGAGAALVVAAAAFDPEPADDEGWSLTAATAAVGGVAIVAVFVVGGLGTRLLFDGVDWGYLELWLAALLPVAASAFLTYRLGQGRESLTPQG